MSETERTRLHKLIDALPEGKIEAVNSILRRLQMRLSWKRFATRLKMMNRSPKKT